MNYTWLHPLGVLFLLFLAGCGQKEPTTPPSNQANSVLPEASLKPAGAPAEQAQTITRPIATDPQYQGKPLSDWLRDSRSENARIRATAVQAIGKIGPSHPEVIPTLIASLKDEDGRVRNEAIDQLEKIGSAAKDAVPALIITLKDESADTRWDSAEALGAIGPAAKEAAPALVEALKDGHPNVRKHAAEALAKIDPEAAKQAVAAHIATSKDPFELGNQLYRKRDYQGALKAFTLVPKDSTNYVTAQRYVGHNIYGREWNKWNEGLPYLAEALRVAPNDPKVLEDAGRAYVSAGKKAEGVELLKKADTDVARRALKQLGE